MNDHNNTNRSKARIVIRKQAARIVAVAPDVLALLTPLLEARIPHFWPGGGCGYEDGVEVAQYYQRHGDGPLWTWAGLVPRIVAHLQRHGQAVKVVDQTTYVALLDANARLLQDSRLPDEERRLLDAVAASPRGQIVVRGPGSVAGAVASIGSLLPRARMLVVASTEPAIAALEQQLGRIADRPVTTDCGAAWRMEQRMLLCTPHLFSCASADDWDCVIFADVEAALASQSFCRMMHLTDQLRYAIVAAERRLGPREQLRLESICGAEIYRQPSAGRAASRRECEPGSHPGLPAAAPPRESADQARPMAECCPQRRHRASWPQPSPAATGPPSNAAGC